MGRLLASHVIFCIYFYFIFTFLCITAADTDASHDKCNKNNSCSLLFAEDIASKTTTGNKVSIFPDPKSNMRLFRLSHADFQNTYETNIVGVNVQCSLGLVDVFLQDSCVGTATYRPSYKECARRRIDRDGSGITRCIFHCSPIFNSNTTFVRFTRVEHVTADNSVWKLDAIVTGEIN